MEKIAEQCRRVREDVVRGAAAAPRPLPLCSWERRGVRDGSLRRTRSRGPLHPSSWLASSSPLCLQRSLQAPVSPQWFVSSVSIFSLLTSYSPSFHPSFGPVSVDPSLPLFPSLPPSLFLSLCFLIDKLTMAPPLGLASGPSHTSDMPGILCTVLHTFT